MARRHRETTYEKYMKQEGPPVHGGYGVTDVRSLDLAPWDRLGGRGAFIQLVGMEGFTGMYVGEVPPGGAFKPERHLFDELMYILDGRGAMEVWTGAPERPKGEGSFFEWQAGSLFSPPLNTWHRLINGSGAEPVRFLAATNAPLIMDMFHNVRFIFDCDYLFDDRYDGRSDYFKVGERYFDDTGMLWDTNFIPDVRGAAIDAQEAKGAGVQITVYEMGGNVLVGHLAEWPVGRYHKAHYHGGGAILLIVRSEGYTLMWPPDVGTRPYENGHADRMVRVDWQEGSVFSPPTGWFHQHFNTGADPARQLALRFGSHKFGVQFYDSQQKEGIYTSVKQGGVLIEYEDEDPEIRRQYKEELARRGVAYRMPELASV